MRSGLGNLFRGSRKLKWAILGGAVAVHQYDTHFRYARFNRAVRTVTAALATIIDYKVVLDWYPERLSELHTRVATRWFNTCNTNGGLYIKLGQSISIMNHVLPPEYLALFAKLQDQAAFISLEEVESVFLRDFGCKPDELFEEFDPQPIASASVAQVHRAKLKDGREVAVKVQKPQIEYQLPWDLLCYRLLAKVFELAFELPIYWTVDITCESVTKETDFVNEARNTRRAAHDLKSFDDVYVPEVYDEYSSERILTLEWIDGVKLSNLKAQQDMGFEPAKVITTAISAFSHQIFITGFVHGDPHPGNVLVRPHPANKRKYQVVILDHGLYMEESPAFREQYCGFWKSIFLFDMPTLKNICQRWGIRDHELFASMQLFKPFNPNKHGTVHAHRTTREDVVALQKRAKERVRDLLSDTNLVPRELIILGRSMNIIRANNKMMGSPVNRVNIMVEFAAKGAAIKAANGKDLQRPPEATALRPLLQQYATLALFRIQLWLLSCVYYFVQLRQRLSEMVGRRGQNFEEIIEQNLSRNIEERLGFKVSFEDA